MYPMKAAAGREAVHEFDAAELDDALVTPVQPCRLGVEDDFPIIESVSPSQKSMGRAAARCKLALGLAPTNVGVGSAIPRRDAGCLFLGPNPVSGTIS